MTLIPVRSHIAAVLAVAVQFWGFDVVAAGLDGIAGPWDPPLVAKEPEKFHKGPYTQSLGHYVLLPGPRSKITEQGARRDAVIRSRDGYILNIQTGEASPGVPLSGMIARLEDAYLGPGRPWERKFGETDAVLAGMPARTATYEGPGSRIKVLIARGARTDFVLIFLAPPPRFDSLLGEFEEILSTFQPAPEELKGGARKGKAGVVAPHAGHEALSFSDPELGYSVNYPREWATSRPTTYSFLLNGRPGTAEDGVSVSIQNVRPPSAGTPGEAAETVYGNLKRQLEDTSLRTVYLGETVWVYDKGGLRVEGLQFLVEYTVQGERFRQTTIVLPRPDAPLAHVWSYQAPVKAFQTYWPMVEPVLKSWTLSANRRGLK
jgi:hypothetical protein